MVENKQQVLKNLTAQEKSGFEFTTSDALMCDVETGICGPINQDKETKS